MALYHFVRPFSLWGHFAPVIGAGYVGVSFFFILSGFILTYSRAHEYEQGRGLVSKFWLARFARLYPVYLVSMIFAAYVNRAEFHNPIHLVAFAADLLMLQSWSVHTVYFFHVTAWTLSCEAFFYLVFPFIFLRMRPRTFSVAILSIAGMWLLALAVPLLCLKFYPLAAWGNGAGSPAARTQILRVIRIPILALPQFLAGISMGWLYLRFRPGVRQATFLATAGVVMLAATLLLADHLPFVLLHNGLLIPIFGILILGVTQPNWLSRLLSNSILVLLGEASYAFYLTHLLFNNWAQSVFGPHNHLLDVLWKLAVTIPLAIVLHLFVERPCRTFILEWWGRRRAMKLIPA